MIIPEVCSVVLQKSLVEISEARRRYLRKRADWYFVLEELSDKWEVCTDRYQKSVDLEELHTDVWEVRTDSNIWEVRIQEGHSDV